MDMALIHKKLHWSRSNTYFIQVYNWNWILGLHHLHMAFFFPKTPIFSWQRWQPDMNVEQVLCVYRPCMMFNKKKKKLLGSLLSSILPQSNGTTDMNVERSNNSQLWNLNTSIQNMYYINWYTFLLTPKN